MLGRICQVRKCKYTLGPESLLLALLLCDRFGADDGDRECCQQVVGWLSASNPRISTTVVAVYGAKAKANATAMHPFAAVGTWSACLLTEKCRMPARPTTSAGKRASAAINSMEIYER